MDVSRIPAILTATRHAGVWVGPTLGVYESSSSYHGYTLLANMIAGVLGPQLGMARKLVKAMQDAGVGLLLGADAPAGGLLRPGVSIHQELWALVQAGLTPYQALATGTRNVATFFGTQDETGTIAVGKRADMVLLDGNPLADIHNTRRVVGVMVGGRWLARAELDRRLASSTPAPTGK